MAVIVHWNGVDVPEELKSLKKGRYVLVPIDEPTDLPEGTELDLVIDDAGDQLDEAERAAPTPPLPKHGRRSKPAKGASPPTF